MKKPREPQKTPILERAGRVPRFLQEVKLHGNHRFGVGIVGTRIEEVTAL